MMTREEATKYARSKKMMLESLIYNDDCKYGNYATYSAELSFIDAVLSYLRPVSLEKVEKVWRGEWERITDPYGKLEGFLCKCGTQTYSASNFCPHCGGAKTDEAVQMVMERLEALHETT